MVEDILKEVKHKMGSALSVYESDLQGMRGGRASPTMLERLSVDYYGQETDLRQLATISSPEPMQLLIRPYDKGAIKAIEKAIRSSELNLNPNAEGEVIRINMPPLTRERRQELVKVLHRRTEEARITMRNIRRNGNDEIKEYEKEKLISEDEAEHGTEEIQKLTDKFISQVEEVGKHKETEIMQV